MADDANGGNGTSGDNPAPGNAPPQKTRREMTLSATANLFGAIWLIGWFLVCLFGILCTMAAQDFQKRMSGATDSTRYTVGYALIQMDEQKRRTKAVENDATALKQAEAQQSVASTELQLATDSAVTNRRALANLLNVVSARLLPANAAAAATGLGQGLTVDDFSKSVQAARIAMQQIEVAAASTPQPADVKAQVTAVEGGIDLFATDVDLLQAKSVALENANAALKNRQLDVKNANDFLKAPPFDNRDFEQLTDDLSRYTQLIAGAPFDFVKLPGIALTLILAVLMGILGSLIAMTRSLVFDKEDITVGEYLYRIGLGASVALAVFFFAGVGALTLAQASGAEHVEPSPYLVSFFGIIAGYLSKRVTSWMREAGGRAFPVREDADRWAIDLQGALNKAQVTADDLAAITGLDVAKIKLWIGRKEAIPRSAQDLISAYVRQPPFQLFSDIPPRP
jgi:hypothetical protein